MRLLGGYSPLGFDFPNNSLFTLGLNKATKNLAELGMNTLLIFQGSNPQPHLQVCSLLLSFRKKTESVFNLGRSGGDELFGQEKIEIPLLM